MPKIEIDRERCKGCGLCTISCPKKLIRIGEEINRQGYFFVRSILAAATVINFFVAARLRRSRRFAVAAVAGLLLFAGRELLQYGVAPLPIVVGMVFLIVGFVIFVRQIVVFYLGL